jgi:hypothetical protein
MSILRRFTITALVAGALISAPAVAFAAAAPSAATPPAATVSKPSPAHAAATAIRKVRCRSYTFNVYTTRGESCFEGIGTIRLHIKNVREITTGENTGNLTVVRGHAHQLVFFSRHEAFAFPPPYPELVLLSIKAT